MTAITVHLPDELAARLSALPEGEVNAYAVAALSDLADERHRAEELSEDDLAAIGRGLAALDAGQVTPGPVAFAQLRAHLDELKRAKQQNEQPQAQVA